MRYLCQDRRRLEVIEHAGSANAIEFLEVLDRAAPPGVPRQHTLFVSLLRPGFQLTPDNVRISGGERIRTVGVLWCAPADQLPPQAEPGLAETVDDLARTLVIRTEGAGDFSIYTLSLVGGATGEQPPVGFDPKLSAVQFSFKVECPSDFDCAPAGTCAPGPTTPPDIDYLAKDYQGFRRLMLDRLSLLVPGWTERSPADVGVALVEVLAYAADNLSYRQDAIANEAYLHTARRRVSVRRHARLVDYFLHEGCNARAFVHLAVNDAPDEPRTLAKGARLLTHVPGQPTPIPADSPALRAALAAGAQVFETVHEAVLHPRFNKPIAFYTWGDRGCCLPRGSTRATLAGKLDKLLLPGALIVFEEIISPRTLSPADADPSHRWAVRLTAVDPRVDPSGGLFQVPPFDGPVDITDIAWDPADALPFSLCISANDLHLSNVLANIVLVDHGTTVAQTLEGVPDPPEEPAPVFPARPCATPTPATTPIRFRPALREAPVTPGFDLSAALDPGVIGQPVWWPASALLSIDPHKATPLVRLDEPGSAEPWRPRRDLLGSNASDVHFVVEVEDDGRARLRFGDGVHGKRPPGGSIFSARYRVGSGIAGNVGAGAIAHIVVDNTTFVTGVRNPLAAAGGVDPEPIEAARRDAPHAFRTQERAVTPADYAAAAERRPEVQRAAATFRWTGSWYTASVTADRHGGEDLDDGFVARMRQHLERFRMAGQDLAIKPPTHVPIDVALHICVRPEYFRSEVLKAVQRELSSDVLPDGRLGAFHPDNFSFGDDVYLSRIIAAAQAVEGVDSVRADRFARLVNPSPTTLEEGVIAVGALAIAQLANNPNFPERGRLNLHAAGGK